MSFTGFVTAVVYGFVTLVIGGEASKRYREPLYALSLLCFLLVYSLTWGENA